MLFNMNIRAFFDNIYASYDALPDEAKLIVYIILILLFIAIILLIIMIEQGRLNKKIVNKKIQVSDKVSDKTEELDFDINEIDESNEKTRNLKEITDKIQAVIDSRAIDLTTFEQDQEENSIISYDELMHSAKKAPEAPDEKFSLPNLVRKIEVDEEIEHEVVHPTPPREEKFKASVFVSPVYGIQDSAYKPIEKPVVSVTPENYKPENSYQPKELVEEETFLTNLINFRKNLE